MLLLSFVLLFAAITVVHTAEAQNPATAFVQNLQSGAIANSLGLFGKNTIFLWYTTVGGELNPEYANQRLILDSVLFLIIFYYIVRLSVKNVWKDIENPGIFSFVIALVLTLALVGTGISIGFLLPYVKQMLFIMVAAVIALLVNNFTNKENKAKGWVTSVVVGLAVSGLLFLLFGYVFQGNLFSTIGQTFNTEQKSDYAARIIAGGGNLNTNDPATNWGLALQAVQDYDYEEAKKDFEKIINYGPAHNNYYTKAANWIGKPPLHDDRLFNDMAENWPAIMDAERNAAEILLDQAAQLPARVEGKPNQKRLELIAQAKKYLKSVKDKEQILEREYTRRQP